MLICKWCSKGIYECVPEGKKRVFAHTETKHEHCEKGRHIASPAAPLTVGQQVICNGFSGVVSRVHEGQLVGMADVRLSRGSVCVDISDLKAVIQ